MTHPAGADTARYHSGRPTNLRSGPPWHRLAYVIRALPRGIAQLSRELHIPSSGRLLDFGCADVPYRRLFPDTVDYVSADLPGNPQASVVIRPDGTVPVDAASCDAVLSTQALEHVADPDLYLSECFRVLKPRGRLLLSTHGVMPYHPDPVDFWRWTCAGLERIVMAPGFELVRFEGIMGLTACGLQLFQDGIYYRLPPLMRPLLALTIQNLIAVAERSERPESRRLNALVFMLIAEKP